MTEGSGGKGLEVAEGLRKRSCYGNLVYNGTLRSEVRCGAESKEISDV